MNLSRRSFIKSAAGSAMVAISGTGNPLNTTTALTPGPGNKWPGRVALVFNKNAASGTVPNETVIKKMVDDAILLLTGEANVGAAWKEIFPSTLTIASKIAIKINILNNALPRPSEFSVAAICEGLCQMNFDGSMFPASNITIYDANNSNSMESAGYTSARFPGIALVKDTFQNFGDGARSLAYAKTLNSHQFLINVFSPRGINSGNAEGFSLGFKSHYGTYTNPSSYHNNASPAHLRDINCTGPVFTKTVLSICSGIFGMNEGSGPRGDAVNYSNYSKKIDPSSTATSPCTIIMSTDPVSVEVQAIKMMRMNRNPTADYSTNALPSYLRSSGGVSGTLTPVYNIGIIDETRMEVRRLINGETTIASAPLKNPSGQPVLRVFPLYHQNFVLIEYYTGIYQSGKSAFLEIVALDGKNVFERELPVSGVLNTFSWNQCNHAGQKVMPGCYIVKITVAGVNAVEKLTLR